MTNHWRQFKKYAIANGIHNGPATLTALADVYEMHKGSRWATIVALFKVRGQLNLLKQYNAEMGYK